VNGSNDLSNLFSRVSALEQEDADSDQTVTRIAKIYGNVGVKVTFRYWVHEYRKCGDTNPIYPAICGVDTFI
jgi:hypothetical protein